MTRVVWGKEWENAWVMDVRDYTNGMYSVECVVEDGGGAEAVLLSRDLDKCIARAKQICEEVSK